MGSPSTTLRRYTEPTQTCEGHTGDVNCLAVSEDKLLLASGSDDCTVRLWRIGDNEEAGIGLKNEQILVGHTHYVTIVLFHRGMLLSGSADQTIKKWDPLTGQCLLTLKEHDDLITSVVCADNYIFTGSNDKSALCWDFVTGKLLLRFKGHTHQVSAIAFHNQPALSNPSGHTDGPRGCLYTGSADRTAKAWSVRSGKCLLTFKGHNGPITQVRIGSDGKILYTCSIDGTVRSWFAESAKVQFVFEGHKSAIVCMELGEKMLYTGSNDRTSKSWLLSSGELVRTYGGAKRTVNTVKQQEQYVITASNDGFVRVYLEYTGSLCAIYGNETCGCCNAIEPLENCFITAATNGLLHVWKREESK